LVVRSPQQVVAESQPPPPSIMTALVERRVLRDTVVLRGTVRPQSTLVVTPAGRDGGRAVLTGAWTQVGGTIRSGQVVLEVSGRPLILLVGAIPAYRDLRPGAEGSDVAQLQAALRALKYGVADRAGYFGEATKSAVAKLYADLGYAAPTTGDQDARAVEEAARAVKQAERAHADAVLAQTNAEAAAGPSPSAEAAQAVSQARATQERTAEDLASAKRDLAEIRSRTGVMMPLGELVFVPSAPARLDKLSAAVGADVVAPLATVSSGPPSIHAHLSPAQYELVRKGMAVEVTADLLGLRAQGTVTTIGDRVDENGSRGYPVVISPKSTLDSRLIGEDVRLAIERASTEHEVLVVPLSAITATANGQAVVVRRAADGREDTIAVTPGTSGDGYVAIVVTEGSLEAGDRVLVGR